MAAKKIIVFGSGSGSNFEAIVTHIRQRQLPVEVAFLFSDNPEAFIMKRAERLGVPTRLLDFKAIGDRQRYHQQLSELLQQAEPWDLLLLAGYMRILPAEIVRRYHQKIINIHPALLPAFPGNNAIEKAFKAKVKVTGVTVHWVDEGVDTGPIISQEPVRISEHDTLATLTEKIHAVEHRLYPCVVERLLWGDEGSKPPRALLSVSDKSGLTELAKGLSDLGWEIISTGGTAKLLQEQGIRAIPVEQVTDFPEILSGRVKTLHPKIFGGLLALRGDKAHEEQLAEQAIEKIDLVAVNFYPFIESAKRADLDEAELIEQIDIGGPSLVRAAAKNLRHVLVLTDPADYSSVLIELQQRSLSEATRRRLALKAFSKVAELDIAIHETLGKRFMLADEKLFLAYRKAEELRYGENPHQKAALYRNLSEPGLSGQIEVLWGKELSYNNWLDTEAALALLSELAPPACVISKHNNPCGVALGKTLQAAYERALAGDPVSAFGGIVALNGTVDTALSQKLNEIFLEIVIAPDYAADALPILQAKKDRRLLRCRHLTFPEKSLRFLAGDLLVQDADQIVIDEREWKVLDNVALTEAEKRDLLFAFAVCKHVKSNAIVVAKEEATLGVGAGQTNRVGSVKLALEAAGKRTRGAVLASDGFFPFADSIELAAQHGIAAIIQPGGSVRDNEVFDAARKHRIKMIVTGVRHFRH